MNAFSLTNKTALVTGASRGIGKAIALQLAEAGAHVAFTDILPVEKMQGVAAEIEQKGVKALAIQANATDTIHAEEVISRVIETFSRLDILVNNVGITRDTLIMRMTEEQWDQVIETNLKSVFNYSKAAIRPMMKARQGSIVNISSVVGVIGNAGQTNYSASKSGIIGFTKSLAREVSSRNIRVNAVAPGYILTDMTGELDDKVLQAITDSTPLRRAGQPGEVACAVHYLASEASSYVTGTVLQVDGGMGM